MASKNVGVAPDDVIWGNLNMNPYEGRVRTAISWAVTIGLIIVWAIPVAFIGAVSNVHSLCATYSWLAWLCDLPAVIVGIISGILPPALLAVLNLLLPIVLRLLARFEGVTQRTTIELSLMTRYFLFQVINSFLVVTLSSGIIASLPDLVNNPASIPSLLARNLPKASNFFLTYVILQGLSGTGVGLPAGRPARLVLREAVHLGFYASLHLQHQVHASLRCVGHTVPLHLSPRRYHRCLQYYLADHQRPLYGHVLPLLRDVQVPVPLAARRTEDGRDGRSVLPEGDSAPVRRNVSPADLLGGVVLPRAGSERAPERCPRGRAHDCSDRLHCVLPHHY
ncbi:hypothetical protein NUW54_g13601 [Trametes sanguinea]|uniref:Uncharacterized protein n=1 Tax=Trametes sanguinea TaxID=158606 RepID=A0ACC1MKD4_9APHY|nr:hypothetical protein NUW54_g13601 [Trametes sanguinea]